MSRKTLWVLVVVLALLAGALWMNGRRSSAPAGTKAAGSGALLPAVDLNTVGSITIEDGTVTTRLEKVDGLWRVAGPDAYPADVNRLREMIRSIDETENAQVAEEGAAHLAEYGLAAGEESAPVRIVLGHEKGTTVLSLGKMRESRRGEEYWGPPAGRYVRVDEGPVLLIKDDISGADADPEQWWDRLLLEVPMESIRQVGVLSGDESFAIERGFDGTFAVVDGAEGETVDVAAANRLFGAWRSLRAEKILPAGEAEGGAAFTNVLTCTVAAEGATYRMQLGAAPSDPGGGRPVRIEVVVAADATSGQQAAANRTGQKLNNRTFLIPAHLADSLSAKRDALIHKTPEAPPAPPPMPEEPAPVESGAP